MKKRNILAAALAALLVLPAIDATAGSEQDDCNLVLNAAEGGRAAAVNQLAQIDQAVADQVASSRSCLERFGDAASRATVTVGGYDIAPLRNMLTDKACSIISSNVSSGYGQAKAQAVTAVSDAGGSTGRAIVAGANQAMSSPSSEASVFDKIACNLFNRC